MKIILEKDDKDFGGDISALGWLIVELENVREYDINSRDSYTKVVEEIF